MFAGIEENFVPASKEAIKPLTIRKEAARTKALSTIPLSQHLIRLEDRKLTEIPKDPTQEVTSREQLQGLFLSRNLIEQVGPSISGLHNLKKLDLSYNRITIITADIGRLVHLEELRLNANQLDSLPAEAGRLVALKHLHLDGNPLRAPASVDGVVLHGGRPLLEVWIQPLDVTPSVGSRGEDRVVGHTGVMMAHLRTLLPAEEQEKIQNKSLARRRKEAVRMLASAREYADADTLRIAVDTAREAGVTGADLSRGQQSLNAAFELRSAAETRDAPRITAAIELWKVALKSTKPNPISSPGSDVSSSCPPSAHQRITSSSRQIQIQIHSTKSSSNKDTCIENKQIPPRTVNPPPRSVNPLLGPDWVFAHVVLRELKLEAARARMMCEHMHEPAQQGGGGGEVRAEGSAVGPSTEARQVAYEEWEAAKAADRAEKGQHLQAQRREWAKEKQGSQHKLIGIVRQKKQEAGWTGVMHKEHKTSEPKRRPLSAASVRSTTRKLYDPHHLYPPRSDVHGGRGGYLPDDDVDENLEVEFTLMQVNQAAAEERRLRERLQQLREQQLQNIMPIGSLSPDGYRQH